MSVLMSNDKHPIPVHIPFLDAHCTQLDASPRLADKYLAKLREVNPDNQKIAHFIEEIDKLV